MSSYFIRKSTKEDENPERVIAVTNSDNEAKLRADDDYEELTHKQFLATYSAEEKKLLGDTVLTDAAPPQDPRAADDTAKARAQAERAGKATG